MKPMEMRILIACEQSGIVRDAFAARGWDAWSCDMIPSGRSPYHFQGDVTQLALSPQSWGYQRLDVVIARPPCNYHSFSGIYMTTHGMRDPNLMKEAIKFAENLWDSPIEHVCIEDSIGVLHKLGKLGDPTQIVQLDNVEEDAGKTTCFWLKNLPRLVEPKFVQPRLVGGKRTDGGQNRLGPSETRALMRAKSLVGIAEAMADQWTRALCREGTVNLSAESKFCSALQL